MAQSRTGKAKRGRARQATEVAAAEPEVAPLRSEAAALKSLEREREELRAELSAAQQRIATLEAQRRQAIDRIDWVIDSLQHVIDGGA